ncbi:hypothetical protein LOTGIDRAFT_155230 [Lottia gigantea]|uniref:G-protein coupled receptors family 1 profile domain-containing protein n=1 Tax=Lottia gigantea TaxID=225164 RepID=V3ZI99_LOTGI|nr:hypothetical protein LOTGIDRAFT_155230 [Lottia gigantea]ESO83927.1 hypothetical protein LOTGIDRAFT_155230 [Lottia gigantea]
MFNVPAKGLTAMVTNDDAITQIIQCLSCDYICEVSRNVLSAIEANEKDNERILGLIGNLIVWVVFCRFKSLRIKSSILILNLSLADLGMCAFGFPFVTIAALEGRYAQLVAYRSPKVDACRAMLASLVSGNFKMDCNSRKIFDTDFKNCSELVHWQEDLN